MGRLVTLPSTMVLLDKFSHPLVLEPLGVGVMAVAEHLVAVVTPLPLMRMVLRLSVKLRESTSLVLVLPYLTLVANRLM